MKLLLIRHADPDYARDSLTQRGWREAGLLAERLARMDITDFYVSPMGRAKDTASLTLGRMEREAKECKWLREFSPRIHRPDTDTEKNVWDWLPQDWTVRDEFYRRDAWYLAKELQEGKVKEEYDWVTQGFDELLKDHGYVREGRCYRVERSNQDTLAFFCHFGVGCDWRLADGAVAWLLRGPLLCDYGVHGRTQKGNCQFSGERIRRYVSSIFI